MSYLQQLMNLRNLMEFVKGQNCTLEELKQMIKEKNPNATIYVDDKITFLELNGSKAIITRSRFDNKWFVL